MFSIDVVYDNGSLETINNVLKYTTICDGRLIRVDISSLPCPLLIPSDKIIRIGMIEAPIRRYSIDRLGSGRQQ